MNIAETKKVLKIIDGVYPMFMRERNPEVTLTLWQKIFADDPYQLVENALMAFIATDTKGFPPMPGVIREKIRQTTNPPEARMTEGEAWGMVLNAIRSANWFADENFAKLPPEIQRIVGDPQTLRDWALMPEDEVLSVVSSNFQRSYRARAEARREFESIPSGFRIEAPEEEYKPFRLDGKAEPEEVSKAVDMPESVREIVRKLGLAGVRE